MDWRDWAKQQWNDVKGNVKFALLSFVVLSGGTAVVTWVTWITRGLAAEQQLTLVAIFTVLFGYAVAVTHYRTTASTTEKEPLTPPAPGKLAPPPPLPILALPGLQ